MPPPSDSPIDRATGDPEAWPTDGASPGSPAPVDPLSPEVLTTLGLGAGIVAVVSLARTSVLAGDVSRSALVWLFASGMAVWVSPLAVALARLALAKRPVVRRSASGVGGFGLAMVVLGAILLRSPLTDEFFDVGVLTRQTMVEPAYAVCLGLASAVAAITALKVGDRSASSVPVRRLLALLGASVAGLFVRRLVPFSGDETSAAVIIALLGFDLVGNAVTLWTAARLLGWRLPPDPELDPIRPTLHKLGIPTRPPEARQS